MTDIETPRTDELLKRMQKQSSTIRKNYLALHAKTLERELTAMTENYQNTRGQFDKLLETNDALSKTMLDLSTEIERLKTVAASA